MLPGPCQRLAGSVLVGDTPDLVYFIGIKMGWNGKLTITCALFDRFLLPTGGLLFAGTSLGCFLFFFSCSRFLTCALFDRFLLPTGGLLFAGTSLGFRPLLALSQLFENPFNRDNESVCIGTERFVGNAK